MSYATNLAPSNDVAPTRGRSVGVIVSAKFPDRQVIFDTLGKGAEREPDDTTFVIRGKPNAADAGRWAVEALREAGRDPLLLVPNPHWNYIRPAEYEVHRNASGRAVYASLLHPAREVRAGADWRDGEMLTNCDLVIVFHDEGSTTTKRFVEARSSKVKVISRGKAKVAKRATRGRKPIGV